MLDANEHTAETSKVWKRQYEECSRRRAQLENSVQYWRDYLAREDQYLTDKVKVAYLTEQINKLLAP